MRKTTSEIKKGEVVHPAGFNVKVKIEKLESEIKSDGGIITGGYVKEELEGLTKQQLVKGSERGVVVELGPLVGKCDGTQAYGLKEGNTVFFERYDGKYFEDYDGYSYIFLREDLVTAYIEREDKDV